MVKRTNLLILVLSLIFIFANKAFAEGKDALKEEKRKIFLTIDLKSRICFWDISKKDYNLTDTNGYIKEGGYSPIEEVSSDPGISKGPEIELFLANFFIRGFYLQGRYVFDIGDVKREDIGTDIGLEYVWESLRAGIFVGWREMKVSFSDWNSENIEEKNISDNIWGFIILRNPPDKFGFIAHMECAFGFKIFSGYEDTTIFEFESDFGYRFKAIPLAINAGYGFWGYQIPTSEVDEHFNSFYNKMMRSIERQENFAHGPILKISYCF